MKRCVLKELKLLVVEFCDDDCIVKFYRQNAFELSSDSGFLSMNENLEEKSY